MVAMAALVERQGKNVALRQAEWRKDMTRKRPLIQGLVNDRRERVWELPVPLFFFLLFFFKIEKRTNIKEIIPPLGSFNYSGLPVFSQLCESVEGHPEPIGWCR